jgi:hypothetical protein
VTDAAITVLFASAGYKTLDREAFAEGVLKRVEAEQAA